MRSTESGFNEEGYLEAAQEQMTIAQELLDNGHYAMSAYLAGLAVECLFLAYLTKADIPYDAHHDLFRMANSSGYLAGVSNEEKTRLLAELHEVRIRWQNNHRYRSDKAYREFITKNKLYTIDGKQKTTRVDSVIFSTEKLLNAAFRILESGVRRWQR